MRTLLGGLLLAIGILIAGISGLCSTVSLVNVIASARSPYTALSSLMAVVVFGGVPFLIGYGLIKAGRVLLKGDSENSLS